MVKVRKITSSILSLMLNQTFKPIAISGRLRDSSTLSEILGVADNGLNTGQPFKKAFYTNFTYNSRIIAKLVQFRGIRLNRR